jgi:hypothetical protein
MAKKVENVDLGSHGSFQVHKGALHEALGIPQDQPIGQERIDKALNSNKPSIRHMAASAKGLTHMGGK